MNEFFFAQAITHHYPAIQSRYLSLQSKLRNKVVKNVAKSDEFIAANILKNCLSIYKPANANLKFV